MTQGVHGNERCLTSPRFLLFIIKQCFLSSVFVPILSEKSCSFFLGSLQTAAFAHFLVPALSQQRELSALSQPTAALPTNPAVKSFFPPQGRTD